MSQDTLRFAVIGAGGYPAEHIKRIDQHGPRLGCRLAAVAIRPPDRLPGQVEAFAARGVEVLADAVEMLDATRGSVDAVFVPTAIYTHAGLVCAALERGHNVYLEKPPAGTVQEIDRMLEAVSRSGRICALGFQSIYSESINFIKARVVAGALGQVKRLRCWAFWPRPDKYYARNEWAGKLRIGDAWVLDGPSNNALAHELANMLYLASPRPHGFARPSAVRAELYHARDIPSEDTAAIEIRTQEGPTAYFIASHATGGAHTGPWIEMDCANASVAWQFDGKTLITYADGHTESAGDGVGPPVAALESFVRALRAGDGARLSCDLEMGRNFTLAVNGAFESAGRVRAIDPRHVRRIGQGPEARLAVAGIDELIALCGREGKLYRDAGAPWATATEPFELADYRQFPRRFQEEP